MAPRSASPKRKTRSRRRRPTSAPPHQLAPHNPTPIGATSAVDSSTAGSSALPFLEDVADDVADPGDVTAAAPSSVPGTSPVDAGELTRIVGEIRATGERSSAPSAAASAAAADDAEQDLLDRAERIVADPNALKQLEGLTEEELADLLELAFGLVSEWRGPHWELQQRSARRLAKWGKRALDRHGWEWAAKWLPDVMALLLLGYEIGKRWREDRAIAQRRAPRSEPSV